MLINIALKNIKNSLRDFSIYFYTLVIGISIFYSFNAISTQTDMMELVGQRGRLAELLNAGLSAISIFVSIVLGLLIVYSNRFLMKRRSKEFGIYMVLGMSKRKVSGILFYETLITGLASLFVGILIGIGISQLMGMLVFQLFGMEIDAFHITVSLAAVIKTIIYFLLMHLVTILLSSHAVGKMKLIDLLQTERKTEQVKLKNPLLCILVFMIGCIMLAVSYFAIGSNPRAITPGLLTILIFIGSIATFFVFWSASGLMLRIVQSIKGLYYRGLNSFTFRQISSKINTIVFTLTIVCLMLFFTICTLTTAFSLRSGMQSTIAQIPADFEIRHQEITVFDEAPYFDDIVERYAAYDYDLTENFRDYVHFHTYYDSSIDMPAFVQNSADLYLSNRFIEIIRLSDYNSAMNLYQRDPLELDDDEFVVLCTYQNNLPIYEKGLKQDPSAVIFGHALHSKYPYALQSGVEITGAGMNTGMIVVADSVVDEAYAANDLFIGNYRLDENTDVNDIEAACISQKDAVDQRIWDDNDRGIIDHQYNIRLFTKLEITESTIGSGAMITILGLYLGIAFLVASGAVLALRELTDRVDSVFRYETLRKIGAEEKDIHKSMVMQTFIVFFFPLPVAGIHSIFGMKMAHSFITLFSTETSIWPVVGVIAIILGIYGGYFYITCASGKRIISPDRASKDASMNKKSVLKAALALGVVLISIAALIITTMGKNEYRSGTPWIDPDIDGVVTRNMETNPKENFALYVNKDSILDLTIPEGYTSAGTFTDAAIAGVNDVNALFQSERPEDHDARLAYDLYWLINDWDTRNELGVAPLQKMIEQVEKISSVDELSAYFVTNPYEERIGSLWGYGISPDLEDSSRYVINITPRNLLLGDTSEYDNISQDGLQTKQAFSKLTTKVLGRMGYSEDEAQQKFENHIAFEAMLAPAVPTYEEKSRPNFMAHCNNHYTRDMLMEAEMNLPILEQIEQTDGYPEADDYVVQWPVYLEKLNEIYTDENLVLMKDYLIIESIIKNASSLDEQCYQWDKECQKEMFGFEEDGDFSTEAAEIVQGMIKWPVAKLYTETYLTENEKNQVSEMVDGIIEAYHQIIMEADFLSETTRSLAIEKLESIQKHILYPDDWEAYSCEEMNFAGVEEGGNYWDAQKEIARCNRVKDIENYMQPVNKDEWSSTPQTCNCFYDPQTNSIYILGAYLRGIGYDESMSIEELYAYYGTAVAHEISHAFDVKGSQFDKDGNMVNWWEDADLETFRKKNDKMAAYYNAIHPYQGLSLRGASMTGEATADMAGMKCILLMSHNLPDFDYDLFFRSFASLWLTKENVQAAKLRVDDPHPMPYLRINVTLQQFDEFLECYDIHEGDGMYLAKEDRINIW
ncbi:MAG: FtsX-like permease family protein [Faecalicoccus sp.]|nr:FtsX-like permease family protein [Faecalicoccus sp.]